MSEDRRQRDVLQPTDDEARALARRLIGEAAFGALAVLVDGAPHVSRIGLGTTPVGLTGLAGGLPLALVSGLAIHTRALLADPRAGLLVGEPAAKGDPLAHPRLSLRALARFVARESADHARLRGRWLAGHPKSKLYLDLPDFRFVVFEPVSGALNGGFARAWALTAGDLAPTAP